MTQPVWKLTITHQESDTVSLIMQEYYFDDITTIQMSLDVTYSRFPEKEKPVLRWIGSQAFTVINSKGENIGEIIKTTMPEILTKPIHL